MGIDVIKMTVGDEDVVGLRHLFQIEGERREILEPQKALEDRIDQQVRIQILDHDTGMFYEGHGTSLIILYASPINMNRADAFLMVEAFEMIFGKQLPVQNAP
jgi:hypothetical protein